MTRNRRLHPIFVALVALLLALTSVVPASAEENENPPAATEQTTPDATTPEQTAATADSPTDDAAPVEPLAETAESPDDAAPGDAAASNAPLDGEPSGEEPQAADAPALPAEEQETGSGAAEPAAEAIPATDAPPAESDATEEPGDLHVDASEPSSSAESATDEEQPVEAAGCEEVRTDKFTRDVTLYYGTVTLADGSASQDGLSLSDHITETLRLLIGEDDVDPRVVTELSDWVIDSGGNINWVTSGSEGLPAQDNLVGIFQSFADLHGGVLEPGDTTNQGSALYLLTTTVTVEGADCGEQTVITNYSGNVTFIELNATVEPDPCATFETNHFRDATIFYGYVTVEGSAEDPGDYMASSDHFTADGGTAIKAGSQEVAIASNIDVWITDPSDDMDWVLAAGEGLDAEQNLRDQYEAFRHSLGGFALAYENEVDRGTLDYLIASWSTFEEIEGCDELVQQDHLGYSRVHYVQLNATVEPDACTEIVTHTRDVTLYYGTVSVAGGGASEDGLSLTDHISHGLLLFGLAEDDLDPRAKPSLADWDAGAVSEIGWVLGTEFPHEGLNAEADLLAQYQFFANANNGLLVAETPIDQGSKTYLLSRTITHEVAENECELIQINTEYVGKVIFFELNATVEPDDSCEPRTITHTRQVTAFFGTVQHAQDDTLQNGLALSDHINPLLAALIAQDDPDPRISADIGDWVLDQVSITWTLVNPEGLDAEQTLRDGFTAFSIASGGILTFDDPISRGTTDYLLASVASEEDDEGCDNDFDVITNYVGRVTFVELNATIELEDDAEAPDGDDDADDDDANDVAKLPNTGVGPIHAAPASSGALLFLMGLLPLFTLIALRRRTTVYRGDTRR